MATFARLLVAIPASLVSVKDAMVAADPAIADLFSGNYVELGVRPDAYQELGEGSAGSAVFGASSVNYQLGDQQPGFQATCVEGRSEQEHFLRLIEDWQKTYAPPVVSTITIRDYHKLLTATDYAQGYRDRVGWLSEVRSAGSYARGGKRYTQGFSFKFLESTSVAVV